MELSTDLLALAVLVALVITLLFATKAIKSRDNKVQQKIHLRKAGVFLMLYLVLNLLRLCVEWYHK